MRPLVLSDRGCPYAHRIVALLEHLGVAYDHHETAIGEHSAEVARYSPSGRIPLLVHDGMVVGESRVVLEHLAELHGFAAAYPPELRERTLHRQAMAVVDSALASTLLRPEATPPAPRLAEYLDLLEELARATPAAPCLLAFHVAPIWLRLQWWMADGAVTHAIRRRPVLVAWLDALAALPAIAGTAQRPDPGALAAACRVLGVPSSIVDG